MQKKNMEIIQAINFIARALMRSSKSIGYAGNKDKRGITTQLISIYNTLPEEVISASRKLFWDKRILVENFFFTENSLKLGQLRGNQFCVALRFVQGNQSSVKNRIDSIRKNGFLNYYGMQRFGCSCIPTHAIGLMVIRNNWEEAVLNILNTNAVREILNLKDFKELKIENIFDNLDSLLKKISKGRANVEFRILKALKNNKKGFYNAFKCLNRQLQVLYPHAYQSFIWNKTVSERIKKFGLQVLLGDIVLKKGQQDEEIIADDEAVLVEGENADIAENDEVDVPFDSINANKASEDEINKIEEKTNEVNKYKNKELYDQCIA
jgi:tRNA pseudouridine13 synthase